MKLRNRIFLSLGIFITLVIVFNYPYISARFSIWQNRNTPIQEIPVQTQSQEKGEPNLVQVPSLNISAPLLYVEENNEDVYQKALQNGVVHFPGTALPGQPGNCYIFGHSSDFAFTPGFYKTVFVSLPNIKIGETIIITDKDGNLYRYKVLETKIVLPSDSSVLAQGDGSRSLLSLQTSYPLGTALKRFVAIAELQKNSP